MKTAESKQFPRLANRNTVAQGDCIEVLRQFPSGSADFVLTDPPYLVNYRSRDGRAIANDVSGEWLKPAFREIFRVLRRDSLCISFYGWTHADAFIAAWREAGFSLVGHLTFTKRYASAQRLLRYQHENAYLLAKGRPSSPQQPMSDVVEWTYSGNKLHPTQKPLGVLRPLIRSFSQRGDLVLDPFCGSGSTLLAAEIEGRDFFGIELDPRYFEIARDRLRRKAA